MRGHQNKKGLPMSDLELLQSSFEYGFYNNNYQQPNNNEAYRMSRKMSEKHLISVIFDLSLKQKYLLLTGLIKGWA